MPGTITSDLVTISGVNSTSDAGTWARIAGASSSNPLQELDAKIESTGCLTSKTSTTVSPNDVGLSVVLTSTFSTTDKHIFHWKNLTTANNNNTKAMHGVWIQFGSDATYPGVNYKRYFLDGSDTDIIGGWKCYVLDPAATSDSWLGTLTANVKTIGIGVRQQTGLGSTTFSSMFTDAIRTGTGLTIKDGTASVPVTFSDVLATDNSNTNAWGILTASSGIYFGAAKFNFGATGQTAVTYFKDTKQVFVFRDMPVASSFYEFTVVGAASYTTTLQLGNYSGGLASDGCVIKGQASPYTLCTSYPETTNDANSNLYSGSLVGAGQSFVGNGLTLHKAVFFVKKTGTPTGTAVAKIYDHSGSYGTTSIPTGAALATSDNFDVASLTTTSAPREFVFSTTNKITLTSGANYVLTIEYSGGTAANYLMVGNDASSPTHGGNYSTLTGTTWTAVGGSDMNFYVYTTDSHVIWKFTASNSNAVTKLYSSTFSEMQSAAFNSASEMRYCTFSNFANITTNGMLINNCVFQNVKTTVPISGTYGLIINGASEVTNTITNSKFINCNRAIKITAAGTYAFSNLEFSGNAYDIENSSAGAVIINASGTSNPTTYINTGGGSTSIVNTKTLSITSLVSGTEIHVYRASDLYEYTGTEAVSGSVFTWDYNADNTEIFITLIKPGYKWVRYSGLTLSFSGISIIATQQADLGYNNPP